MEGLINKQSQELQDLGEPTNGSYMGWGWLLRVRKRKVGVNVGESPRHSRSPRDYGCLWNSCVYPPNWLWLLALYIYPLIEHLLHANKKNCHGFPLTTHSLGRWGHLTKPVYSSVKQGYRCLFYTFRTFLLGSDPLKYLLCICPEGNIGS